MRRDELLKRFQALSHELRIRILQALEGGPLSYAELARLVFADIYSTFDTGKFNYHLRYLLERGLIRKTRSGRKMIYELTPLGRKALYAIRLLV